MATVRIDKRASAKISKADAGYQYRPETEYRCEECVMSKPIDDKQMGCAHFGPGEPIKPFGSCTYFEHAAPGHAEIPWLGLLTKIELGYTENREGFSCKRCEHFEAPADCEKVRRESPGDTPGIISPSACCSLWEADPKRAKMTSEALLRILK